MKLKPWEPGWNAGLDQCVVPSRCQATDTPSPASFMKITSLNGTKSGPFTASATARSPGWPYSRRTNP